MRGGKRDEIDSALEQRADVLDDAIAIEVARRVRAGVAADQPAPQSRRNFSSRAGFQLRVALMQNALDVGDGEEPAQLVGFADDEQLVHPDVLAEKLIGARDGIGAPPFRLPDGLHAGAWGHRLELTRTAADTAAAPHAPAAARADGRADRRPEKSHRRKAPPLDHSSPARRRCAGRARP